MEREKDIEFDLMLDRMISRLSNSKTTSPSDLERISYFAEKETDIRRILNHPNTPHRVFERLSRSDNLNTRTLVAESSRCPEEVLRELSDDNSDTVRARVAKNQLTPEETLFILSLDPSKTVRLSVGENKSTPNYIIRQVRNSVSEGKAKLPIIAKKSDIVKKAEAELGKDWQGTRKPDRPEKSQGQGNNTKIKL